MTKTVLVTGSTGFVGRQVLKTLLKTSLKVRLVVREGKSSFFGSEENFENILITSDLFSEGQTWWEMACEGVDLVIHLAWYAEPGRYIQSEENINCLIGTLSLMRACKNAGVRRFIGIGTCFEYDLGAGYVSPRTALLPKTTYAAAKASAFLTLSNYFEKAGIEFAWCRLFYLYGENEDRRRLVPYIRDRLAAGEVVELTSGRQIRDFLDVEDAGKMIASVALGSQCGAMNICSGKPITVRALAEEIAREYGRHDLLKFGARPDNEFDPPCVVGISETNPLKNKM